MKMVHIGAGSFVFAPTVLVDTIVNQRVTECELVLVDVNPVPLAVMAGVGRRLAKETGADVTVRAETDRASALADADFVIVSAAVQGVKRWHIDYDILRGFNLADQARECGGLGGLSNSFRAITLVMSVVNDMERLCPKAVLLDVTNPMPRVVTAVNRYSSIDCFGFCNIAYSGPTRYKWFGDLLGVDGEQLDIVTAGLNHFAWVVSAHDKTTDENIYPLLEEKVRQGTGYRFHLMQRWLNEYGGIVAGHVDHHAEWLPFQSDVQYQVTPPYHGTEAERANRWRELSEIAEGSRDWHDVMKDLSWEHPVAVAAALSERKTMRFDMVNLVNRGYLPQLPDGRVVEVPIEVANGQVSGLSNIRLPEGVAQMCCEISDVHELVVKAAVEGDRRVAMEAVERDPAITDKRVGMKALDRMLEAHADLLPQFT